MHKPTPSMTMTRTPGLTFEERRVLRLLANHTYDEVVQETGWSRGRIYNLAIRVGASDQAELSKDIHATRCLLVCADIANGSKHLSLSRPKVGGALSEATGLHLDTEKGICQEFYYVSCTDPADEFHGMEIRTLLRRCRDSWEQIINCHYLSQVDTWVAQQNA